MTTIATNQQIIPFLWFNGDAQEAMELYTSIFPHSKILTSKKWGPHTPFNPDWIMMGSFCLNGLKIHAFDAGPQFRFNESMSLFVNCETQEEIDLLWDALTKEGGSEGQCGWLKDKFGLSWQIVPTILANKSENGIPQKVAQMMQAMMGMKKLDIAALDAAYNL